MKMKKQLKIIIPILFISVFGYFGFQIYSKVLHKKEVEENTKVIPKFEYQNITGGVFTNESLKKGIPTIFIYYNSECEFCNEEAQMIKQNIEKLSGLQLIFISFEERKIIKSFATKYRLSTYGNIHFLCDTKITFANTFDVKSLPCIVLYDKKGRLVEKIKGQVKVETVLKRLNAE